MPEQDYFQCWSHSAPVFGKAEQLFYLQHEVYIHINKDMQVSGSGDPFPIGALPPLPVVRRSWCFPPDRVSGVRYAEERCLVGNTRIFSAQLIDFYRPQQPLRRLKGRVSAEPCDLQIDGSGRKCEGFGKSCPVFLARRDDKT